MVETLKEAYAALFAAETTGDKASVKQARGVIKRLLAPAPKAKRKDRRMPKPERIVAANIEAVFRSEARKRAAPWEGFGRRD